MSLPFNRPESAVVRRSLDQYQPRLNDWAAVPMPPKTPNTVPDVMDFLADLDQRRSALLDHLRAQFDRN
jgi:hypothetical protein